MPKIFTAFLNDCEIALNDEANTVWSRTKITAWADEAFLAHPILRPRQDGFVTLADADSFSLPADFREIVSVEYPTAQDPPVYLRRMSRYDPAFHGSDLNYDIDFTYTAAGWTLYTSVTVLAGQRINFNYLANHTVGIADDSNAVITIKDEHYHIAIAYVVYRAYQERLSTYMQDPTAYSQIINQMAHAVDQAKERYDQLCAQAIDKLSISRHTPRQQLDKFDKVY